MQVRVVYNKSVYIVLLVFGATVTCVSSPLCAGINLVRMFFNVKKSITWCTFWLLSPSYTTYYIYQYMVKNIQRQVGICLPPISPNLYLCLRQSNFSMEAPSIFPCSAPAVRAFCLPCTCVQHTSPDGVVLCWVMQFASASPWHGQVL